MPLNPIQQQFLMNQMIRQRVGAPQQMVPQNLQGQLPLVASQETSPQFTPPLPPNTGTAPEGNVQATQVSPDLSNEKQVEKMARMGDVAKAYQNAQKSVMRLKEALAKINT